jgi:hypothetical protein
MKIARRFTLRNDPENRLALYFRFRTIAFVLEQRARNLISA